MKTTVEPGEYQAQIMGYEASSFYGKRSFYIVLDVVVPGERDPLRLRHYINARYAPSVSVANLIGWVADCEFLRNLDPNQCLAFEADTKENFDNVGCNVILASSSYDGKARNDIKFVYRKRLIKQPEPSPEWSSSPPKPKVTLEPIDPNEIIPF